MSELASILTQSIGMVAAILTTCSFLPQAIKVIRTRQTKDLSLAMYVAFTAGVTLWLIYGLLLGQWPLILANAITLLLAAIILTMKLRHG